MVEHDKQIQSAQAWTIEDINFLGRRRARDRTLRDSASIRLQAAGSSQFVSFNRAGEAVIFATQSHRTATLVIYKADVPDATHPATCDAIIRDGDYVYLRRAHPDSWLRPDRAHGIRAGIQAFPFGGTAGTTGEVCLQEKQVCYNDAEGLLYCAWVPSCPGSGSHSLPLIDRANHAAPPGSRNHGEESGLRLGWPRSCFTTSQR